MANRVDYYSDDEYRQAVAQEEYENYQSYMKRLEEPEYDERTEFYETTNIPNTIPCPSCGEPTYDLDVINRCEKCKNYSTKHSMFEFATESVIQEGGDGDFVIISESYQQLADDYDEWNKTENKRKFKFERGQHQDGTILFSDKQEAVWFVHPSVELSNYKMIKIYYPW